MIRTWKTPLRAATAVAVLLILAGLPGAARAQDAPPRDWNNQGDTLQGAVGLHYGKVGGHGLAFRLPVQWFLYLQAAGGIWHTGDDKRHNVGAELQYILRQDARLRLYLAAGLAYFYHREKTGQSGGEDLWDTQEYWNVGFGVGAEILQGRRWSFQIEGNFYRDGKSDDIKITPQAGIYFYW